MIVINIFYGAQEGMFLYFTLGNGEVNVNLSQYPTLS